jgi:integrase
LESITKGQAFGGAFPLQKKNIFFSFYLTKAELLALTYNDIDLEKRTISVRV